MPGSLSLKITLMGISLNQGHNPAHSPKPEHSRPASGWKLSVSTSPLPHHNSINIPATYRKNFSSSTDHDAACAAGR